MILTPEDESIYFPGIGLTGDTLIGCLARAQAFVESYLGCGRPIERRQYVEVITFDQGRFIPVNDPLIAVLRYYPVVSAIVEGRRANVLDGFQRRIWATPDWLLVDPERYELDPGGRLVVYANYSELRITYNAGFDFTQDSPEVREIKAIAGMLAIRLSVRSDIESTRADGNSFLYSDLWDYFRTVLQPLKRYYPRGS